MKSTLLILSGLALLCAAASAPASAANDKNDTNILTVTGNGEVRVTPDLAVVTVGAETRAPRADDAIQENNRLMARIVTAIRALNIPDRDIQTATYNVSLQYEPVSDTDRNRRPTPIYVVSNLVTVRLREPARAGAVVDAATGAGANVVQGLNFIVEKETDARRQALQAAARDAQGKAEAIAAALGVRITGVDSIVEGGAQVFLPATRMAEIAAPAAAPILPGENVIRASVTVRYRIAR